MYLFFSTELNSIKTSIFLVGNELLVNPYEENQHLNQNNFDIFYTLAE